MTVLNIDIETYSSVDLKSAGVYKYCESPDFEIMLIGYRYDDGVVQMIDMANAPFREVAEFIHALTNPAIIKTAYNAQFEMVCLARRFDLVLDPAEWRCTMADAARLGLPFGLDKVAQVLQLGTKKDTRGRALIKYFSVPCTSTIINGGRTRNLPHHAPDRWAAFIDYCRTDVITESAIRDAISFYTVPDFEKPIFALDQTINARGVLVDLVLVKNAIRINDEYTARMISEAVAITGLRNPNSVAQLRAWLEKETGADVPDLRKDNIPAMIAAADSAAVRRVLEIRQRISKSSIKKYYAMLNGAGSDGRIRGLFQYYGANRTGRWAGRHVQVQNLIKNNLADLDVARGLVRDGDLDQLELMYGNVPAVLSQLIRTAFVPRPGRVLLVSDLAAIEARIIAWLAGETWRMEVFAGDGKIYEASAAAMFRVPVGMVDRDMRAKGKIAELALGYQGGTGALLKMGSAAMGIPDEDLPGLVSRWRAANGKIVALWADVERAAIVAVQNAGSIVKVGRVAYQVRRGILFCKLPSGREMCYWRPRLAPGKFGGMQVTYEGLNQTTKQWTRMAAYGGLLVENITQAIARDVLAEKMMALADRDICLHVHDEIVLEVEAGMAGMVDRAMAGRVEWAPGLVLGAESFETLYYKK